MIQSYRGKGRSASETESGALFLSARRMLAQSFQIGSLTLNTKQTTEEPAALCFSERYPGALTKVRRDRNAK